MHLSVLVIGEDPEAQLAQFGRTSEVAPYRAYLTPDEIAWAQEHCPDKPPHEAAASLASERLDPDGEPEIGPDAGGRYYIVADRIYNRLGQWDWYQIGGRWAGSLLLRPGASGACGPVVPLLRDWRLIEMAEDML